MNGKRILNLSLACFFSCCEAAPAEVVDISPAAQTIGLGSQANVALQISGLGASAAPSLGAYDVTISFNPLVLQFANLNFGDPVLGDQLDLFGLGNIQSISTTTNSVEIFELSLDSIDDLNALQAANFTLATLIFNATGVGTSPLNITVNALSDAYGDALGAGIRNGSVAVSAVPEPRRGPVLLGFVIFIIFSAARLRWV